MLKIAIDPDTHRSGVAIYDTNHKSLISLSLDLFPLLDFILNMRGDNPLLIIEHSLLISHNFTAHNAKTNINVSTKIANYVGQNHCIANVFIKFCIHNNIQYKTVKPLKKCFGVKGKKITHKQLLAIKELSDLGFNKKTTNQEERDAILLALYS